MLELANRIDAVHRQRTLLKKPQEDAAPISQVLQV